MAVANYKNFEPANNIPSFDYGDHHNCTDCDLIDFSSEFCSVWRHMSLLFPVIDTGANYGAISVSCIWLDDSGRLWLGRRLPVMDISVIDFGGERARLRASLHLTSQSARPTAPTYSAASPNHSANT